MELGVVPALRMLRELRCLAPWIATIPIADGSIAGPDHGRASWRSPCWARRWSRSAPVTDGDALCYHLQVPKVFLMHGAVGFDPDLHETVYPLVTELLYAVALEFRGPVACRWIQWVLGLVFAANVTALARPSLGRRAWWAGAIVLLVPAVSNGMSAPLNDVALAAFGTAAIFAWTRLLDRPSPAAAAVAGVLAGLAIGVKYPALVLVGLLGACLWMRGCEGLSRRRAPSEPSDPAARARPGSATGGGLCSPAARRGRRLVVSPRLRPHGQPGVSVLPPGVRRGGARRGARPDQAADGGHALEPAHGPRAAHAPARPVRQLLAPVRADLPAVPAGALL